VCTFVRHALPYANSLEIVSAALESSFTKDATRGAFTRVDMFATPKHAVGSPDVVRTHAPNVVTLLVSENGGFKD
jgi:hypothetical protein